MRAHRDPLRSVGGLPIGGGDRTPVSEPILDASGCAYVGAHSPISRSIYRPAC